MKIDTPRLVPIAAAVVGTASPPRGWQEGEVLRGAVARDAAAGETVRLRIGGETLQLRLNQAVAAGQELMVRIVALRPELRVAVEIPRQPGSTAPQQTATTTPGAILRGAVQAAQQPVLFGDKPPPLATGQATPAATSQRSNEATAVTARTLNLLPAQEGIARLMMLLNAAAGRSDLPPPLRESVAQILRAVMPGDQAGDATRLRQAVRDSGLFLEARLAQAVVTGRPPTGLEGDLKALLLRIVAAIPEGETKTTPPPRPPGDPPPPPTRDSGPTPQPRAAELPPMARETLIAALKQSVTGALARIVLHQFAAVEQQNPEVQRWLLELPLRAAGESHDIVHMLLERERRRSGSGKQRWTARIALDLPGLGAINARITVGGGNEVDTWLWTDAAETAARIHAELPRLHEALAARDLTVTGLGCREERTAPAQSPTPGGDRSSLIDTEA